MSRAIAFLAGMGAGHLEEKDRIRQRAREDERDQWARDDRQFAQGERDRAVADRDALRTAGAPVPVESGEVYQPAVDDDGNTMPANPTAGTFKVGAARFAERGAAVDAAGTMRRERVQAELDRQDPVRGDQYRATGSQLQANELAAKKHVNDMLKEGTLDALTASLGGASSDEVASIFNRNGKSKVAQLTVEPFEFDHPTLGKQRSARLVGKMEDGSPIQIDDAFARSLELFGAAKRFDLLNSWSKDKAARDDKAADNKRADAAEVRRGVHEDRMFTLAQRTAAAAERKATGDAAAAGQVTVKDKRDFENDLSSYIKDRFPIKEGADQKERDALAQQANSVRAMGQTMFHVNATLGQPLTAGTVGEAIELARDRKNVKIINVGGTAYEGVMVNGQPVITSNPLERKPAAAPAAPPAAATPAASGAAARPAALSQSAPAARATQGVAPAPAAPPAAPPAPAAIPPEHQAALKPLNERVMQLAQQMAAVARSGDQQAIASYAQQLQSARAARDQEAVRRLGPNVAQQYVATLSQ